MDSSYKIAVLDHFALYKALHFSNTELDEFYQNYSNFIQLNQNTDGCIGSLPVAIYSIHACVFYININNQVNALYYCKIASNIFQSEICIQGLLSIKALMSNIYAQMNQYETAISTQLGILDKIDDDFKKACCLENIGKLYFKEKDYTKAANYFHESVKIAKYATQSHFYILYLLLNQKDIQDKNLYLEDISNYTEMNNFYRATISKDSSVFELFDKISSSITDFNLKKLYSGFIYKLAKQINHEKALYYADRYITLLTSSRRNTVFKNLDEIMVFM